MDVHESIDIRRATCNKIADLHARIAAEELAVTRRGRVGIERSRPSLQIDQGKDLESRVGEDE